MKLKTTIVALIFIVSFLFITFNNKAVLALPQYCTYDQSSHKCCGGAAINCTDVDPDNPFFNKFCNGGVITPSGSSCPY